MTPQEARARLELAAACFEDSTLGRVRRSPGRYALIALAAGFLIIRAPSARKLIVNLARDFLEI